ncbi:hypothetical protein Tco_0032510 [Tanacetum coccineum]
MDLETSQTTTTGKLPILKQGEYNMWRLRIEQYFQLQDYALWDVIENRNSFKPVAQTTTNADGTSTSLITGPKIESQLAILGEKFHKKISILKFLRSLPSEWNTHVVVWRNKPDLDTMSFDDLYNNFKIVEQEVKGTVSSSSSSSSHNMAFVSSPSSTNEVNIAYRVSTNLSKITRKPSKMDNHGHEKWKSTKEARDAKPKIGKVKKSKLWSTSSQLWVNKVNSIKGQKPQNIPFQSLKFPDVTQMAPKA